MISTNRSDFADRRLPASAAPAAIEAKDITKSFGAVHAVSGVSFVVPKGSFTTILGASGSGKTTMLRLVAGLETLDAGEIRMASRVVSSRDPHIFVPPEQRKVGLVFQSYALWPHLTVFDQVAYPLKVRKQRENMRERVISALELVGMDQFGSRFPAELSGGQQQRVAVARAIVYEPDVLLLDEPLSNLDTRLRERLRHELHSLHQRLQLTTVLITHDQSEALSLSDHVILMSDGRITEAGSPQEVYERPRFLSTTKFVGASNELAGEVNACADANLRVSLDCGLEILVNDANKRDEVKVGSRVVAAIKPEDIEIAEQADRTLNAIVESIAYFGAFSDVVVRLSDQSTIRIRTAKSFSLAVGSKISLNLPPGRLTVYPPEHRN